MGTLPEGAPGASSTRPGQGCAPRDAAGTERYPACQAPSTAREMRPTRFRPVGLALRSRAAPCALSRRSSRGVSGRTEPPARCRAPGTLWKAARTQRGLCLLRFFRIQERGARRPRASPVLRRDPEHLLPRLLLLHLRAGGALHTGHAAWVPPGGASRRTAQGRACPGPLVLARARSVSTATRRVPHRRSVRRPASTGERGSPDIGRCSPRTHSPSGLVDCNFMLSLCWKTG